MLQLLNDGLREAKIPQRRLAQILETDQASISRKLRGKRSFRFDEISEITALILEQISSLPPKTIGQIYVSSPNVVSVFLDDSVCEAAGKMRKGDFTQLPVIDRATSTCKGIATDFALLRKMLSPDTVSKKGWLSDLGRMKIKEADIIDAAPIFPLTSSVVEIAQALIYHYAVLVQEPGQHIGIVTRADFLKLFTDPRERWLERYLLNKRKAKKKSVRVKK
jgi:predicted transcriptional regulator